MLPIAHAAVSLLVLSNTSVASIGDKQLSFINDSPKESTTFVAAPQIQKATTATQPKKVDKPAPILVTVSDGDTLSSIAAANNTTYERVYKANDTITDPNVIQPGQVLRIPTEDEALPDRSLPANAPVANTAVATRSTSQTVTAATYYSAPAVSGNDAKAFIYSRESGNNPNATNPSGCYGLGQDCNGVLRSQCGADYACQDAYFTDYATRRYGGWEGALSFWQANGWW